MPRLLSFERLRAMHAVLLLFTLRRYKRLLMMLITRMLCLFKAPYAALI